MRVAVLSDIHSNVFALQAVLDDLLTMREQSPRIEEVWIAGDMFGYYPWAAETFRLLSSAHPVAVLGNHDEWVACPDGAPADVAGRLAEHNAEDLRAHSPEGLAWLTSLPAQQSLERGGLKITLVHGTPDEPLQGRYYPDDRHAYAWLPAPGEVLILGQTHRPLMRGDARSGLILNPGSVGQPRDGNPMPSWILLDLETGRAELRRTYYDNRAAMSRLSALGWNERITRALNRRN